MDELTAVVYGDVNCDGEVTVADLICAARHLVVLETITEPCRFEAADANGDGRVNIADIIRLERYLAEIDVSPLGKR